MHRLQIRRAGSWHGLPGAVLLLHISIEMFLSPAGKYGLPETGTDASHQQQTGQRGLRKDAIKNFEYLAEYGKEKLCKTYFK